MLWLYNKDGAKLFNSIEDAPKYYVDCPTKVDDSSVRYEDLDRDKLKAKALEMGLEFPKNIKTDKLLHLIEAS